jgi:hypothetical protein
MSDTKQHQPAYANPIFDQMAFLDIQGFDCVTSSRAMKVLRWLRKGATTEGILANNCGERVFLQEWTNLISKLLEMNYIKSEPTGHGLTKRISITERGEQYMEFRTGPKEVEEPTEVCDDQKATG